MSNLTVKHQVRSQREAAQVWANNRVRNGQVKLAHNTYLIHHGVGVYAVRYHYTDIVTFYPNGDIVADNGGWGSPTTRNRLNKFTPAGISFTQRDYTQYVHDTRGERVLSGAMVVRAL